MILYVMTTSIFEQTLKIDAATTILKIRKLFQETTGCFDFSSKCIFFWRTGALGCYKIRLVALLAGTIMC